MTQTVSLAIHPEMQLIRLFLQIIVKNVCSMLQMHEESFRSVDAVSLLYYTSGKLLTYPNANHASEVVLCIFYGFWGMIFCFAVIDAIFLSHDWILTQPGTRVV